MATLQNHLKKTLLAGVFAAVPIAGTAFVIWWVDHNTRILSEKLVGMPIPFLGILIALAAIYLLGLVTTTLLGKWFIATLDRLLGKLPGLKQLYATWKQIALTPGGGEGMFARVVLVRDHPTTARTLGFTSGQCVNGDENLLCVFIPNAPNPIQGRLVFVERSACQFVDMSAEEAFKLILSTGNYIPAELRMIT
jgi:uncharacterized membrane protein